MAKKVELNFIDRVLKTTGIVLLICFVFGLYYFGVFAALAFLSGGIWGMINLLFISELVKVTIRPEGADKTKALGLAVIKFPLLYSTGYFLLKVHQFNPLYLLAGFSLLFLIIILKVVARAILGLDYNHHKTESWGQVK